MAYFAVDSEARNLRKHGYHQISNLMRSLENERKYEELRRSHFRDESFDHSQDYDESNNFDGFHKRIAGPFPVIVRGGRK